MCFCFKFTAIFGITFVWKSYNIKKRVGKFDLLQRTYNDHNILLSGLAIDEH